MRGLGVIVAIVLSTTTVFADDATTFHKGKFGLSGRLSLGVRGIIPYDDGVFCGDMSSEGTNGYASACTGRTPMALDLELSYGVKPTIELVLELRIGLETDIPTTPGADDAARPFHIAPGARFFFSDTAKMKLFVQPELVLDFANYATGNDFGVRGIEGLWIDLHRSYGVYVFVAETLGFSRWLSAAFEGGVGFQGRYP
jgi:hypothetical protein